jgi:hypothetical protein
MVPSGILMLVIKNPKSLESLQKTIRYLSGFLAPFELLFLQNVKSTFKPQFHLNLNSVSISCEPPPFHVRQTF